MMPKEIKEKVMPVIWFCVDICFFLLRVWIIFSSLFYCFSSSLFKLKLEEIFKHQFFAPSVCFFSFLFSFFESHYIITFWELLKILGNLWNLNKVRQTILIKTLFLLKKPSYEKFSLTFTIYTFHCPSL